ncbi:histidine biosynthesis bifunctional protein HisIE [Elysia marginata]|uniref:Histidine biosynthesis bifunctional protein HisIE n=1 Tax=Elysia marginata TaxID=1093978 RepID=A0AAV4I158_9GAST|nr:histidine biosynthesis bifunctional protein HisIE [Elysia marginata]
MIVTPNFNKNPDRLVPAIIQDSNTKKVLMLGYMDESALKKTMETKRVTFLSRRKKCLWTKGEESGNFLELVSIKADCDNDALLVLVKPKGPICHKGTDTCWGEKNTPSYGFISNIEHVISERKDKNSAKGSYIKSLFEKGINKITQKVGEEAVELIIEAKGNDDSLFLNEATDLLFHYLILLQQKGFSLKDVETILEKRAE